MDREPREIGEARALLEKFETYMHKPEGIVHLSEALALLADVRESGASEGITQLTSNIVLAYARKANQAVEHLAREPVVHIETVAHWQKVFAEFEQSGVSLPSEITTAWSRLLLKKMTPSERQSLLEKLQAMKPDRASS
jgi:hypothetical protein